MLKYFSGGAVEQLYRSVEQHLNWYYSPSDQASFIGSLRDTIRESRRRDTTLKNVLETGHEPSQDDATNAMILYGQTSLKDLQPQEAADERLWVYLCHMDSPQYVAGRWLKDRPADDKLASARVRNHFFARNNRAIIRDNGLSRLWWLGCIAYEASPDDPRKFLEIILHRQDLRSALIERPSVSMNLRVLRAVYGVMEEHWDSAKQSADSTGKASSLFSREVFRDWMIRLNRRGGVVLLDALDDQELAKLVRFEADAALARGPISG